MNYFRSKNAASSFWLVNRLRLNQCQQLRLRRQQRPLQPLVLLLLALLKWQEVLQQAMRGDEDVEAQTPRRAKLSPVLPCHLFHCYYQHFWPKVPLPINIFIIVEISSSLRRLENKKLLLQKSM